VIVSRSEVSLLSRKPGLYPFVLIKDEAETHWDTLEPFIERSVRHSRGMVTVEGIRQMLFAGDACVIGTAMNNEIQAVTVCSITNYATYRAATIIAAAGKDLKAAMAFFHIIEGWALACGCSEVEAWCRPSVARLLRKYRWRQTYEILTIDLRRKLQ